MGRLQYFDGAGGGRTGRVRWQTGIGSDAVADDQGPWNALGASLFWAGWAAWYDEPKLRRNLAYLADHGFDFVRVFAQVGYPTADGSGDGSVGEFQPDGRRNWWDQRHINPGTPYYVEQLRKLYAICAAYGLRVELSIFGGATEVKAVWGKPGMWTVIDRVLESIRGVEDRIILLQLGNEIWQTGIDVWSSEGQEEAREYMRYIRARTDVPLSISDTQDDWCPLSHALYDPLGDEIAVSYHMPRDGENGWRHVRCAWESCGFRRNWLDEPDGPELYKLSNPNLGPQQFVSAAVTGYCVGHAGYVYHSLAGCWGGIERRWEPWDRPQNLDEHDPQIARAFAAMTRYLPPGLATWKRWHIGQGGEPYTPFFGAAGSPADGANDIRAYGCTSPDGARFVCNPIGVGSVQFTTKARYRMAVIDAGTGDTMRVIETPAGGSLVLDGPPYAYVLVGERV